MSRTAILSLVLALLLLTTAASAVTLTMLQAFVEGTSVRVEWEVLNESGLQGFDLYRKGDTDAGFVRITTVSPTGQRRYQYLDANLYRTTGPNGANATNGSSYTYRLAVKTSTGEQSYTTVLSQTPSAVQRSWGSIKSMFR